MDKMNIIRALKVFNVLKLYKKRIQPRPNNRIAKSYSPLPAKIKTASIIEKFKNNEKDK